MDGYIMALIVQDRVKETSTTTGTGTITLAGAADGFQSFSVIGNANTTYYCITDGSGNNAWEVGIGTWATGNTLARTTILSSSNSGNAITLGTGTHNVFTTYPAERSSFATEGLRLPFTASGAITAGSAVARKSDGTMEDITESTNTTINQATVHAGSMQFDKGFALDQNTNTFVVKFYDPDNSSYTSVLLGTIASDGSITLGSRQVIWSVQDYSQGNGIIYHSSTGSGNGQDFTGFVWTAKEYGGGSSGAQRIGKFTFSGTTITAVGGESNLDTWNNSSSNNCMVSDPDKNIVATVVEMNQDSTTQVKFCTAIPDGSSGWTSQSDSTLTTAGSLHPQSMWMVYDPDLSQIILFEQPTNNYVTAYKYIAGSTNYSIDSGTEVALYTGGNSGIYCAYYDTNINKTVAVYITTQMRACHITSGGSGVTLTKSNDVEIVTGLSNVNSYWYYGQTGHCTFDDTNNFGYFLYPMDSSASPCDIKVSKINSDPSSLSVVSTTTVAPSSTWGGHDQNIPYARNISLDGDVFPLRTWDASYNYTSKAVNTQTATTSNVANYYGIAQSSASDGEEVFVNVEGSISEQTGLTPLSNYYVQDDGTITTTSSSYYAGQALSATQLSMKANTAGGVGSLTLTASGGVTAGDPISIKSDGKGIKTATGTSSTATAGTPSIVNAANAQDMSSMTYAKDLDMYICTWRGEYNYPKICLATMDSSGNFTYGATVTNSAGSMAPSACQAFNHDGGICISWLMSENTDQKVLTFSVSGTTLTEEHDLQIESGSWNTDGYSVSLCERWDGTGAAGTGSGSSGEYDNLVIVYNYSTIWGTSYGKIRKIGYTSSGNIWNANVGTADNFASQSFASIFTTAFQSNLHLALDTDTNMMILGYRPSFTDSGDITVRQFNSTSSLALSNQGSAQNGTNQAARYAMCYNQDINKIVIVTRRSQGEGTDPSGAYGFYLTPNASGDITWGSAQVNVRSAQDNIRQMNMVYSDLAKKMYTMDYVDSGSGASYDRIYLNSWDYSASSCSSGAVTSGTSIGTAGSIESGGVCYHMGFNPTTNMVGVLWIDTGGATARPYANGGGYSVFDYSSGYVGASQTTASDGQSITVNTIGNTDANQSALTIGSKVYLDAANSTFTSTSTGNTEAGIALSATKFLINK